MFSLGDVIGCSSIELYKATTFWLSNWNKSFFSDCLSMYAFIKFVSDLAKRVDLIVFLNSSLIVNSLNEAVMRLRWRLTVVGSGW